MRISQKSGLRICVVFAAMSFAAVACASSPIVIRCQSSQGQQTWSVKAGDLPELLHCRARLVWRYAGETAWRDEMLDLPAFGGGRFAATLRESPVKVDVEGRAEADAGWEFSGRLTNTGNRPIELSRFHYLDGGIETSDALRMRMLISKQGEAHCRMGQKSPPIRNPKSNGECWWDLPSKDGLLPDVIYDEPNWVCAIDSGVFFRSPDNLGWVMGATGPGKAFGEIGLRSSGSDAGHFYAGQLLDNILLAPGETRELERLLVLADDWQQGLRHWARVCSRALGASSRKNPFVGFLSWYRNFCEFTTADIDKAIAQFAAMPIPPGGRIIQIDDGWQRAPGDWKPNQRFTKDWWEQLPKRITASGSIPGLYLTPLTVLETNPIVKEHPEWFQRLPDGRFAVTLMNWGWCDNPSWKFPERGGRLAYNLDPDHPGAREFIRAFLKEAVAAGWLAFKFDFNASCPNARAAYDRRRTTFETLRGQFQLFRETVGPDIAMNACVGCPWRYTVGYADSCRVGGDMVGNWTTMRTLLPTLLLRMATTNGIWWSADPDVFYMREKAAVITGSYFDPVTLTTSKEEQSLLLTVNGMMGGMFYTSDLPSEWSSAARKRVLEFWGTDKPGPAENPRLAFDPQTDLPYALKVERTIDGRRRIQCALFNFSDQEAVLSVNLSKLGLPPLHHWSVVCSDDGISLQKDELVSKQPAHSARWVLLSEEDVGT